MPSQKRDGLNLHQGEFGAKSVMKLSSRQTNANKCTDTISSVLKMSPNVKSHTRDQKEELWENGTLK